MDHIDCTVRRLGVDEVERKRVFGGNEVVPRFKFIDAVYRKWVELKRGGGECEVDIYDLIDSKLSGDYNVESLLNDFRFIVSTNREALGFHDLKNDDDGKEEDDDSECNVNDCFVVNRSERNKATMTRNEQKRKDLFFVTNELEEDGAARHSVILQQILDSAHIWCRHTLRVKTDQFMDDTLGDDDDDEKETEIDWSCTDRLLQEFGALIERKKKSSNRFRSTERERATNNASKFMTMSTADIQSTLGLETGGIPDGNGRGHNDTVNAVTSFQEEILEEVRATAVSQGAVQDFYEFIESEQFDTDGLKDDLREHDDSVIVDQFGSNATKNGKGLKWVLRKLMFEDKQRDNLYSSGFRFFYKESYSQIHDEWNVLYIQDRGQPAVEGNRGHKISDFYVL